LRISVRNSSPITYIKSGSRIGDWRRLSAAAVIGFLTAIQIAPFCSSAGEAEQRAAADRAFRSAQDRFKKQSKDSEAGWQFGRACFDLAEFATNSAERAEIANQGIAACQGVLALASNSAAAHYYLGMNLGQLARTRGLGALKIIKSIQREFEAARELDENFDHAGPDRNLGLLYRDAPSIGSVGSRTHARQHLQRSVDLAPDYPENALNLIESCLNWGDRNGAKRALKTLEEAWPVAKSRLTGPEWASSWADWEERSARLKKKVEEPSKVLQSPRAMP
jgi:hypothetical protein